MTNYKGCNNEGFVIIALTDEEWNVMQEAVSDAFEDGRDSSWYKRALAHCDVLCQVGISRAIHRNWDKEMVDDD